ncbi:WG repeat-containing protein [Mucilaginibacter celer]|nr:WG repeat-containing protein [Mucilaginibacter celer]
MMRYLLLLFLLGFGFNILAQQRIELRYNRDGMIYSGDTDIVVSSFNNGRASFTVKSKTPGYKKSKVGFIDSAGIVKVPPVYVNCSTFQNGQALVQDISGKINVIDSIGKLVLPAFYYWVAKCDNGLFVVWEDGKFGLFTSSGKQLFPPSRYTRLARYFNPPFVINDGRSSGGSEDYGLALSIAPSIYFKDFMAVQRDGLWGVINRDGVEILPPTFEGIGVFRGDVAIAIKHKKKGLINSHGDWLVPPIYEEAWVTGYKSVLVTKRKKKGVITYNNSIIVPIIYDEVKILTSKAYLVYKPDKAYRQADDRPVGVVSNGKVIVPIRRGQRITAFGSGFIIAKNEKNNFSLALYDSIGMRITNYMYGYEWLFEPVWSLTNPADSSKYIVFNAVENRFVSYTDIVDIFYNADRTPRITYYKKNNLWGLLDERGVEITPPIYEKAWVGKFNDRSLVGFVKLNGKWGVIDNHGKTLLNFEYDDCGLLRTGCFWLKKDGRCRFILHDLQHITGISYDTPAQYTAGAYYDNIHDIPVQKNGKWGFLNNYGREVAPCIYDEFLSPYRFGKTIIPVRIGNKWGFLNKHLKPTTPVQYDKPKALYFGETLRGVLLSVTQNHKYGLIDTGGHEIAPCIYDMIVLTTGHGDYIIRKGKLSGLIHPNGQVIVKPQYDGISCVQQGFYSKDTWYWVTKNKKSGLMNEKGEVIIPCLYDELRDEETGNLAARKDNHWGMINLQNKVIVPFRYDEIREVRRCQDTAKWVYVVKLNGKYGLVDANYKMILPFKYDFIDFPFSLYQNRPVIEVTLEEKRGLLDWDGKIFVQINFRYVKNYYPNCYVVEGMDGKEGMLDQNGREILAPVYDNISFGMEKHCFVSKGKKVNVVTYDGKFVFDEDFDSYEPFRDINGYFQITKNGKYGLLDCDANLIYPCIYRSIRYEDGKIIPEKF